MNTSLAGRAHGVWVVEVITRRPQGALSSDPSVCMSVRALSSKRCIFKPNSYYGTLYNRKRHTGSRTHPACPPELAETGGTCGFAAIWPPSVVYALLLLLLGLRVAVYVPFAQLLMLRLTLQRPVSGAATVLRLAAPLTGAGAYRHDPRIKGVSVGSQSCVH